MSIFSLPFSRSSQPLPPVEEKSPWLTAANVALEFVGFPALTGLAEKGVRDRLLRTQFGSLWNDAKALGITRFSRRELGFAIAAGAGVCYGLDTIYRLATHQEQWEGWTKIAYGLGFAVGSALLLGGVTGATGPNLPDEAEAAAFFRRLRDVSFPGVTQEGSLFRSTFRSTGRVEAWRYSTSTGNLHALTMDQAPTGMGLVASREPLIEALRPYLLEANNWGIIHFKEEVTRHAPLILDQPWFVEVTTRPLMRRGTGFVEITRTIKNYRGEILQEGKTTLALGTDLSKLKTTLPKDPTNLGEMVHTQEITPEFIDAFARGSGDLNPVHMTDASAKALGLPGRVAHGMSTYNSGELALMKEGGLTRPARNLSVKFAGMARVGDTLSYYRKLGTDGKYTITAVNQEGNLVMEMLAEA